MALHGCETLLTVFSLRLHTVLLIYHLLIMIIMQVCYLLMFLVLHGHQVPNHSDVSEHPLESLLWRKKPTRLK